MEPTILKKDQLLISIAFYVNLVLGPKERQCIVLFVLQARQILTWEAFHKLIASNADKGKSQLQDRQTAILLAHQVLFFRLT